MFQALLVFLVFWVLPGLGNIVISLTNWSATASISTARFFGLKNYVRLWGDPGFWNGLKNNALYGLATVVVITALAFLLAVLVERGIRFGRWAFRSAFFFPVILPWVVVGLLWRWLYDPSFGMVNVFLKGIGLGALAMNWLGDTRIALVSVIAVAVWKSVGFHMIIFIAGLQGVPRELEQAASIDGANQVKTYYYVVLPILRPIVGIVTTLILIDAFRLFDVVFVMTNGGPGHYSTDVLSTYIYRTAFNYLQQSYGSTLAVALFVLVAVLSGLSQAITTRRSQT